MFDNNIYLLKKVVDYFCKLKILILKLFWNDFKAKREETFSNLKSICGKYCFYKRMMIYFAVDSSQSV